MSRDAESFAIRRLRIGLDGAATETPSMGERSRKCSLRRRPGAGRVGSSGRHHPRQTAVQVDSQSFGVFQQRVGEGMSGRTLR
jgi:hypothetical protein